MRSPWRWAAAIALLLASPRALAAGQRVGVPKFDGEGEAGVRMKVMQALQAHGYEVVRARELQEAMALAGASLDSDGDLKSLARELGLSAIVTAEVGPRRAKVVVHDGGDGSILGDASFAAANPGKLAEEVGLTFWKKLGPDVKRGQPPAGPKRAKSSGEAVSAEASEPEEAPPPAQKPKKKPRFRMEEPTGEAASPRALPPGAPWLDLELGVGGLHRSLTFNQSVAMPGYGLVLPYSLGVGPIGVAKLVAFPWVEGKGGNFGVEGRFEQGVGISTGTFSNSVHDYAVGFRYRIPFATTDDLFFSLTFGEDAFTFSGPDRSSLPTPDTIYHYVRAGAGMHLAISDGIGISFTGGYRYVSNHGGPQISEVFPHLTVAGADADLGARVALNDTFELRACVGWRRYWYAAHTQPGDSVMASGADDQSFVLTAGIAVVLGVPKAAAVAGNPPTAPAPKSDGGSDSGQDQNRVDE